MEDEVHNKLKDMITAKLRTNGRADLFFNDSVYLGYAYRESDGYYVFMNAIENQGAWSSYSLDLVSNKLRELNKPWNDKVNEYFEKQNEKNNGI